MEKQEYKSLISQAGEFRVASELARRGYNASVTYGNAKATDIIVIKRKKYLRVEVKTTSEVDENGKTKTTAQRKFVTSYYPKYTDESDIQPDIWVFVWLSKDGKSDRFFIADHKKIGELQLTVNKGTKTKKGEGCDNIPLKLLEEHAKEIEDNWKLFE